MANTDKINLENLKIGLPKIKEWILDLYPLKKQTSEFDICYDTSLSTNAVKIVKNGTRADVEIIGDTIVAKDGDTKLRVSDEGLTAITMKGYDGGRNIIGWDGKKFKALIKDGVMRIKSMTRAMLEVFETSPSNQDVNVNASKKVILKENGNTPTVRVEDGDLIITGGGNLYLNIDPSEIPDEYVETSAVYAGSIMPNGYITTLNGSKALSSGTSFQEFATSNEVPNGCYIVTYELYFDATVDNKVIGGRLSLKDSAGNKTVCPESGYIIGTGSDKASTINGTALIDIPYGTTGTKICIDARQNFGDNAKTDWYLSIVKIA